MLLSIPCFVVSSLSSNGILPSFILNNKIKNKMTYSGYCFFQMESLKNVLHTIFNSITANRLD